ncbi:DUF6962 family protein [Salinispira pacifica]|uniref:Uncharacterized protein n=1 Tax=Salinispira pacifica TaxID=1307761 RepID=V5WIU4_9SPIO|nr:hypothetical protein [Salinispira pacifica]AHC15762.1 hypothetical protein L21SP2_2409 [Salinispira pacifica]
MEFISIETELTTAVTDFLLGAAGAWAAVSLMRRVNRYRIPQKPRFWAAAFGLLSLAGFLGFFAHGFEMSDGLRNVLWQPLYLSLGLTISMFAAAVLIDLRKKAVPRGVMPGFLAAGALFYLLTLVFPGSFLIFILYEALAMIFALGAYIFLSVRSPGRAPFLMTAGIFLSILAAAVQAAGSVEIRIIWLFDHNGVFHIIQMAGLLFLYAGVKADEADDKEGEHAHA